MKKEQIEQLIGKKITQVIELKHDGSDFSAYSAATAKLKELGVSHGSMQRDALIGLAYGDYDISKWRNLGHEDILLLDGVMQCSGPLGFRNGDVTIYLADKKAE